MIDIDGLRQSLDSFADQARPADLGPAALHGARRRRRRRRISVTVVLLLLAGVLVPMTVVNLRHGARPVEDLPAGPMGPLVVAAYAVPQEWYVIDPVAGGYRPVDGGSVVSVSPNLRLYTDLATWDGTSSLLRITSTSAGGPSTNLTIDGDARIPVWSPDGNWLALAVYDAPTDSLKPEHGFTDVVFVDVLNGTMRRQQIRLDGRYGTWVRWSDDSTLLVGTERARGAADAEAVADGVAMVRRNGKMVSWHEMPAGEPCAPTFLAVPLVSDGKLLICAYDGSEQVYRVFDPQRGKTGPELGRLRLPPSLHVTPTRWDGDDRVALRSIDPTQEDVEKVQVAHLSTGEIDASPAGVPDGMQQMLLGSSDGLPAAAWKLTF